MRRRLWPFKELGAVITTNVTYCSLPADSRIAEAKKLQMTGTFSAKVDLLTGMGRAARELGKYRVLAELGRGGMANVYLAALQGRGAVSKLVVLKALLPEVESEPDSLALFLDEARLAALLNHGNVVQTYEVGAEGDRHVIVMEYLEGQSLAGVLRRADRQGQPLPRALHLRVLIDVLEGLHYAHELKGYDGKPLQLVHRDISPQNVFITYDGRTKLLDFGIAKAATSTTHTATGIIKGKLAYMPPEQLSGDSLDRRADLYAFGCMLWAAAAGQKLWKDVPDTQILRRALLGDIPSPQASNPSCDDALAQIVMKALATDKDQRYSTALELQEDLERYCEQIGAANRPRELSRFVSSLFADTRAELKARVEHELSVLGTQLADPVVNELTRSAANDVAEAHLPVSSTQTISASSVGMAPLHGAKPKPKRWVLGVAGLALALGAYAFVSRSPHGPSGAASASASPATHEPESSSKLAVVKIELRASPTGARVFLDGELVEGNPALRVLPTDGKVHELRAELAGHQTASAQFTATRDDVVELRLDALKAATSAKSTAPPRPAQQATKKASATKPNCTQPFFVDSDGIKKVKPGCL
jgi:eukaryotic-like serine/threonine-protein kinase